MGTGNYKLALLMSLVAIAELSFGCGDDDDSAGDAGAADGDGDADTDADSDTDTDTDSDGDFDELRSDIGRNMSPDPTEEELDAMRLGNFDLSMNLLKAIAQGNEDNLSVSAFSFREAFGMVYAAARGQTATEISDVMGFLGDQERTHNAMNYYDLEIMSRNLPASADEDPVIVATANRMFVRPEMTVGDDYLDVLALNYGAGMFLADFGADPDGERQKINAWVEEKTHDRIQDLLPEGSITLDTVWVLVNALYLKAPWKLQFEEDLTEEMAFTLLDGSQVSVPTMHSTALQGYYLQGEGYKLVDLPLRGDKLSMTFILPDEGEYEAIEQSLDADTLEAMYEEADAQHGILEVYLPKFEVETGSMFMNDILKGLGMETPFGGAADMSGFGPDYFPGITFVYHSVFVAVDEVGVEAAAATAAGGDWGADYPELTFDAHRPFIFIIRDRPTGLALFAGRVMDPS